MTMSSPTDLSQEMPQAALQVEVRNKKRHSSAKLTGKASRHFENMAVWYVDLLLPFTSILKG